MPAEKPLQPENGPAYLWGSELRHYRQAANLSQPELAQRIFCSRQLVGAMETCGRVPDLGRVKLCDEALDTGGALRRLFDKLDLSAFPRWFRDWPPHEERAVEIRNYEALVVPGLLQTEAYMRALLEGDEVAIQTRIDRQTILTRTDPPPPRLRCIVDEGVLRREVGSRAIMRAQLDHMVTAISPRLTLQVVPLGIHSGLSGNFQIATLSDGASVAYVDTAVRGLVLDRPDDIAGLAESFESLRTDALPQTQSREMILRAAEQWT
jgi:transcriptional regulator with XRE-family HTH domain